MSVPAKAFCLWMLTLSAPVVGQTSQLAPADARAARFVAVEKLAAADRAARGGEHARAVKLATAAIETGAADPSAFYLRGRERLRLGDVKASVTDFDRYIQLRPDQMSRLWERGIACYYAGQYQQGADQFRAYQTYHANDVENAVWHLLCASRRQGFAKAQAAMLPIRADGRIPMMKIHDLYRGSASPQDVLRAARAGSPGPDDLNRRLFYAHLYLGLYYEARGETGKTRQHLEAAVHKHPVKNYMWDVAKVHLDRMTATKPSPTKTVP